MDDTTLIVVLVVAVVVVLAAIALAARAKRRRELRSRFGPEYDRTVSQAGSARKAEKDLRERQAERERLHLRELTPAERDRYRDEWQALQASFVDRPDTAVSDADRLVTSLMRDRGYPVDDFERQAALVSVDHPQVVTHYRAAHAVHRRLGSEQVTTEDERQALVHYRALFEELMVPGGDDVIDMRDGDSRHPDQRDERDELDRVRAEHDLADDGARRRR